MGSTNETPDAYNVSADELHGGSINTFRTPKFSPDDRLKQLGRYMENLQAAQDPQVRKHLIEQELVPLCGAVADMRDSSGEDDNPNPEFQAAIDGRDPQAMEKYIRGRLEKLRA